MLIEDSIALWQTVAPESLAESWDPVGLHVGAKDWAVHRVLVAIDLTDPVLAEAKEKGCDAVIAYHPPIFKGIERVTDQSWQTRRILNAARQGIAVYSPHTALDATVGGVCDWLCDGVVDAAKQLDPANGEQSRRPIVEKALHANGSAATSEAANVKQHKVVVFVPVANEQAVRQAMAEAGAGEIGNYRQCAFSVEGQGCFKPLEGANPAIGQVGALETVTEKRLEMLVESPKLEAVLSAIQATHPYEEPAVDVFDLRDTMQSFASRQGQAMAAGSETDNSKHATDSLPGVSGLPGAGRVVVLSRAVEAGALAEAFAGWLGLDAKQARVSHPKKQVCSVAVCPGAGASLFEGLDADLLLTGEMRHHDMLDATQHGRAIALYGHTNTERPFLPLYAKKLKAVCPELSFEVSEQDQCPWLPL